MSEKSKGKTMRTMVNLKILVIMLAIVFTSACLEDKKLISNQNKSSTNSGFSYLHPRIHQAVEKQLFTKLTYRLDIYSKDDPTKPAYGNVPFEEDRSFDIEMKPGSYIFEVTYFENVDGKAYPLGRWESAPAKIYLGQVKEVEKSHFQSENFSEKSREDGRLFDHDRDGLSNLQEIESNSEENQKKGLKSDFLTADSDGDGIADDKDDFPGNKEETSDQDGDGVGDKEDNCPSQVNGDQQNTDGDQWGDECDRDDDNDGIEDDFPDNCPLTVNSDQLDTDRDRIGDLCDPDIDNDGRLNEKDDCPNVAFEKEICDGIDNDCDGKTDIADKDLLAPLAKNQKGVCKQQSKNCAGKDGWQEPDYDQITDFEENVETRCDGLDNDCDGKTDENLIPPNADKLAGLCAGQKKVCAGVKGWQEPDYNKITGYQQQESLCDHKDNDCNGFTDESFADLGKSCDGDDVDQCKRGTYTCSSDGKTLACLNETVRDISEQCNGVDDDCNGKIDEDLTPEAATDCNSKGVCNSLNFKICMGYQGWQCDYSGINGYEQMEVTCDDWDNDCDGKTDEGLLNDCGTCGQAPLEICDGKDNDCDGQTDESLTSPDATLNKGVCTGQKKNCQGVNGWKDPDYTQIFGYQQAETYCDGFDNDCDGKTDEDLSAPAADTVQGVCVGQTKVCKGNYGWQEPDYTAIQDYNNPENLCDGKDNDCDNSIDEELPPASADSCNQNGVCGDLANKTCHSTQGWVCNYGGVLGYEPTETSCDGKDNDCDTQTDEDLRNICDGCGVLSHTAGAACDGNDIDQCANGTWTCKADKSDVECVNEEPQNVVECLSNYQNDHIDNDCDGQTDETEIEICGDSVDNDCDGKTDGDESECICVSNGDAVQDPDTGLIWQKGRFSSITKVLSAKSYCANLSLCSLTDWRLPTIYEYKEILSNCDNSDVGGCNSCSSSKCNGMFPGDMARYWTSTSESAALYWFVDFLNGRFSLSNKWDGEKYHVKCLLGNN